MLPAEPVDDLVQKRDFADADAVEPDTRGVAAAQQGLAGEFVPQAAAVLAGGQRLIEEPGRKGDEGKQIDEIEQKWHGTSFPCAGRPVVQAPPRNRRSSSS